MNFTDFSQQIPKIENLPLPGMDSHFKMAPMPRILELKPEEIKKKNPKKAGVMALFFPDEVGVTQLLLILRKTYEGVHSNQIGFPGGKRENDDKDLLATALRETYEEVGVHPKNVSVIKPLSQLYIPPSNFEVHPYIGLYNMETPFVLQKNEVEAIVTVSLVDFMDDKKIIKEKITTSYAQDWEVPAFKLNGYVVWGATAMVLSEVKELFKQVL
ncbi:MAG: coenzyme A pyrophosphatase [Flavobacteriaceae bacterium]|nr:MAG: coenzyme A pyrophosphatase [Flavobacteriaceae bacterium]